MKRYFLILMIFSTFGGYSQTAEDSLLVQLNYLDDADHDSIYYELFLINRDTEPSKALYYARQHLAHSIRFQDINEQVVSYRIMGISHMNINEFDSALYFSRKAYHLADSMNIKLEIIKTCAQMGGCYIHFDNYKKSVEYYLKFLELSKTENLPQYIAIGYNNLGLIYYRIGDYYTALDFYLKCLNTKRNYSLTKGMMLNYLNIGLCYIGIQQYSDAIIYFKKIINNCINCDKKILIDAFYGIGKAYSKMKDYNKAMNYLNLSSEMALKNSNYLSYANSNILVSEILINKNDFDEAIRYLDVLEDENISFPSRIEYKIMLLYSIIYEKRQNFEKALYYKNQYIFLKESVLSDRTVSEIKNLLIDYQQSENEAIIKEKEIQVKRNRQFVYMFGVLIFLISIVLLFAYRNIKIRKKLNDKLSSLVQQRTQEFNSLLYRFSHDLAGPVATIKGLLGLMTMSIYKNNIEGFLLRLNITNKRLEEIIQKLNTVSKINSKTLEFENIDIHLIILDIINDFDDEYKNKIKIDYNGEKIFRTDKTLIHTILRNILLNSLQHSDHREEKHEVKVDISNNGNLTVKISDNGKGIEPNYSHKIFDLFYVATDKAQGNGLGLYQAKLAAQRLKGDIKLISNKKPITFEISIQKHRKKLIHLAQNDNG